MEGGCAWDDGMGMNRGGTVYERVMTVQNAGGDMDFANGVCRIHGDPSQFVQ